MLHLRGHQGLLGDPIYSLHMSKMHGPFGVNLQMKAVLKVVS
jgi:hypothetical protein